VLIATFARAWDVIRTAASMAIGRMIMMGSDQPAIHYVLVVGAAFVTALFALTWNTKSLNA
jgi:predicted TIM-barrel fold metal-dependent hydrolase